MLVLGKHDCKASARAFGYRMSDWPGEGLQYRDCMLTIVTRCVSDRGSAKSSFVLAIQYERLNSMKCFDP